MDVYFIRKHTGYVLLNKPNLLYFLSSTNPAPVKFFLGSRITIQFFGVAHRAFLIYEADVAMAVIVLQVLCQYKDISSQDHFEKSLRFFFWAACVRKKTCG